MATMEATHTVEGLLAVEVAPRAFVVESGQILTRTSATKCGGWEGLEIGEYSGSGTVEVSDEQLAAAERVSALEVEHHGVGRGVSRAGSRGRDVPPPLASPRPGPRWHTSASSPTR